MWFNSSYLPGRLGRLFLGCALAALSAALLTLSLAPYDVWWLIWVALVPMVVAQYRVLPARWSALGPALGVGGFLVGYCGGLFPERAAWYMRALPVIVAIIILLASRSERTRWDRSRTGYAVWPLAATVTWVAVDLIRASIPVLGTWGFFGFALYRQAWLIQPVRVFGLFGLDFVIAIVNYALAMAVLAVLDRRGAFEAPVAVLPRHARRWCAGALAMLVAWCTLSLALRENGGSMVRVAVLQPGIRRQDSGTTALSRDRAMLDQLEAQTREASGKGARLVVWPEAALGSDPAVAYAGELGDLARETGASVVVGYAVQTPAGSRNEVVTVDPKGELVGRYGKDHPVLFLGGTSISRGTYPTIEAPFGKMAAMICYDMDFTDTTRRFARQGVQVLAVPSSDWPAIATKHYTHAVFRALESGAVVAKSEFNRDSAIVDGYGRIAASAVTPEGSRATLVAEVPLRSGIPLAAQLGDWVGWLCLGGLIGRALLEWRSRSLAGPPMGSKAALRA